MRLEASGRQGEHACEKCDRSRCDVRRRYLHYSQGFGRAGTIGLYWRRRGLIPEINPPSEDRK